MEKMSETSGCCPQEQPCKVSEKSIEGAYCKCDEGWQCSITKIIGPDAGKTFFKCEGGCVCSVDGSGAKESSPQDISSSASNGNTCCECGEGWSCVITKVTGPDAGKPFFECGEGCSCEIIA